MEIIEAREIKATVEVVAVVEANSSHISVVLATKQVTYSESVQNAIVNRVETRAMMDGPKNAQSIND